MLLLESTLLHDLFCRVEPLGALFVQLRGVGLFCVALAAGGM